MQAHPEDMLGDTCALCARGDEQATDWVCCDRCGSWQHFSCDTRPGLGAFKVRLWCAMSLPSFRCFLSAKCSLLHCLVMREHATVLTAV